MKKILFIILLTVLGAGFFNAAAQKDQPKTTKYEIRHQGMDRTYWLYIPENLRPDAPLVFVLHGYGGKAEGYRPEMVATAKKHGFAVCYPQGAKDGKGKNCWNVGYSFQ
jgi:polyhydroxybutyrate depolymerase